jgi:hypothetical protein
MNAHDANVVLGWVGILCGVIAGSVSGLFFHAEDWAGGYASFRRRMLRLGHISLVGLGILNILFGLTARDAAGPPASPGVAAGGLILGLVTMPLCCYLTAWRKTFRHLFPIPVVSVALGIILALIGWLWS